MEQVTTIGLDLAKNVFQLPKPPNPGAACGRT